jgi:hypothetical protein
LFLAPAPVRSLPLRRVCLLHRVFDFRQHRRSQKEIDELRIELGSPPSRNRLHRLAEASGVTVTPAMRDRIEAVGDRNDSGRERDSLAF